MAFSHNQTITMLSAWLLASCFFTSAFCLQPNVLQPFDLLYESGISAYYSNEYSKVVNHIEGALDSYATLKSIKVSCWLKCRHDHGFETLLSSSASLFDIAFFNVLLHRAYCIKECQTQQLGVPSMHQANIEIVNDFYRRTPYNYLQHAYFKLKQFDKAAAAAHTFFMANPEHVEMQQNLEHYKLMAGADEGNLIDREAKPHMEAFSAGVIYYDKQMYTLSVKSFEEALEKYYKADLECRALCDQPLKFTEYEYLDYKLPLYEALADHYTQILSCEHDCVRDLATRSGRISPLENYLPSHYEYLQFSYYKAGEYGKALQCAKAYLLFHPEDEDIMGDIEHYDSLLPDMINPKDIEPRKDAMEFMHRYLLERELLKQVSDAAGVRYYEPKYWVILKSDKVINRMPADAVMQTEVDSKVPGNNTTEQALREEIHEGGPVLYDNIKLVYQSEQLNGSHRVMMDEVITPQECKDLHQVAQVITFAGDGYKGRMSPHTPNERFEGATVLKALLSGYNGQISLKSAQLFYEVSEKARTIVESYFRLNSTLYFSYTHMVCRTAITGHQDYRNDLSHPIHADNCLLDPEINICWKEPPAFTYRDYSAILYLNGDFDGGEFIFTTMDTKTVTASVKPRCGRMVSFSSGGENPHGVRAVTKGQRCALAMWFTLDPVFREVERLQADEVMATIQEEQQMRNELDLNPKDEL